MTSPSFLDAVAFLRTVSLCDVPEPAAAVAGHCLLDWCGCALAGSREPLSAILRSELVDGGRGGAATIVGASVASDARTAALVNGAAGHALDFDDTHTGMSGHSSAPILPAVLALGEEVDAGGEELLASFVVGVEVACRLGLYLNPAHYRLGWHATGTIGTVGAAAAAARLLRLGESAWRAALNLAVTQAAGLKASFATMAKPLHAGKAASDGLLAGRLAAAGFTAADDAVDGTQGMVEAAAGGSSHPEQLARSQGRWLVEDVLFKYHASCYLTHSAINAASSLRGALSAGSTAVGSTAVGSTGAGSTGAGFSPAASIEEVVVEVHPSLLGVCAIAEPRTALELKFSLRATTAMALLDVDTADLASFTAEQARDAVLLGLEDKVRVVTSERLAPTHTVVHVRAGGRQHRAEDDTGRPDRDLPLQHRRLMAKCRSLAAPVLGPAGAEALVRTFEGREALGARDLGSLLAGPAS